MTLVAGHIYKVGSMTSITSVQDLCGIVFSVFLTFPIGFWHRYKLAVTAENVYIRTWDMLTIFLGFKSYRMMTSLSQVYHIYGTGSTHMLRKQ